MFYPKQSNDYFTVQNKIYLVVDVVRRQDLKPKEAKLSIVNQQRVVYHFVSDLCDAEYVGYTTRHLIQRVAEHKNSAIRKHFRDAHGWSKLLNGSHFKILRKCQGKLDCLVFEVLYNKKFKPNLVQNFLFPSVFVLLSIYRT